MTYKQLKYFNRQLWRENQYLNKKIQDYQRDNKELHNKVLHLEDQYEDIYDHLKPCMNILNKLNKDDLPF